MNEYVLFKHCISSACQTRIVAKKPFYFLSFPASYKSKTSYFGVRQV